MKTVSEPEHQEITKLSEEAKKEALLAVAIFPAIMLVSYLLLMAYFKSIGGYRAVDISEAG